MDVDSVANILFYNCAFKDVSNPPELTQSYSPLVDHLPTPVDLPKLSFQPQAIFPFLSSSNSSTQTQGFPHLRENCTSMTAIVLVPPNLGH